MIHKIIPNMYIKIVVVRVNTRNASMIRHLYNVRNNTENSEHEKNSSCKLPAESEDPAQPSQKLLSSYNDVPKISGLRFGKNNYIASPVYIQFDLTCRNLYSIYSSLRSMTDQELLRRRKVSRETARGGGRMFFAAMSEVVKQDFAWGFSGSGIELIPCTAGTSVQTRAYSTRSGISVNNDSAIDTEDSSSLAETAASVEVRREEQEQSDGQTSWSDTDDIGNPVSDNDLNAIKVMFPRPKEVIHNFYHTLSMEFKNPKLEASRSYRPVQNGNGCLFWRCTYTLQWPESVSFSSDSTRKSTAADGAAFKALHWLYSINKISDKGAPVLYKEIELEKVPVRLEVDPGSISAMNAVLELYEDEIEPFLEKEMHQEESEDGIEDEVGVEGTNGLDSYEEYPVDNSMIDRRNNQLYRSLTQRRRSEDDRQALPIMQWRSDLCQLIENNRTIIVKGEPGCGKSTQVPQFIFDDWISRMQGAHCNIIVTQPRRISAISLAERVAFERGEMLGDSVGYQVRFRSALPKPVGGYIVYCSTGILLRRLQSNPGLVNVSHVILDEAHERDVNIDFLMVLLRRALVQNPKLKVIVMSATLNPEVFQSYFNEAASLHVPGFTHPVDSYYLEDLYKLGLTLKSGMKGDPSTQVNVEDVAKVIMWINSKRPPGAILTFLPGWSEIVAVTKYLEGRIDKTSYIVPVHSRLPLDEQRRIFSTPVPGARKIILATNIAESSITIDDVRYVVDCGTHKEERLDPESGLSTFGNHWISQANANQRKGRAGRVSKGESYHLYTKDMFKNMVEFPIPEVQRVPLEKIVLDCKLFSEKEKAKEFLSEMPEPPTMEAVCRAVAELIDMEALDYNENLTDLGKRIAAFTAHPKLSKALVHACILRCMNPVLTVSTVLSNNTEMFTCSLSEKETTREKKKTFHPKSDHLALAWLYEQWNRYGDVGAEEFCSQFLLRKESMEMTKKLRKVFVEHLYDCKMVDDMRTCERLTSDYNRYSAQDEIVKGVLLSGWGNILIKRDWDMKKGRISKAAKGVFTETGHRATISSDSVNYKCENTSDYFFTHFYQTRSLESGLLVIRETSIVTPLIVLLFKGGDVFIQKVKGTSANDVIIRMGDKCKIICSESDVDTLLQFRSTLSDLLKYFVAKEGKVHDEQIYEKICRFRDNCVLPTLVKILRKADAYESSEDETCDERAAST